MHSVKRGVWCSTGRKGPKGNVLTKFQFFEKWGNGVESARVERSGSRDRADDARADREQSESRDEGLPSNMGTRTDRLTP